MKSNRNALLFSVGLLAVSGGAQAQFLAGNLVVSRVGDGGAALTNAATATFLDQYTTAGAFVNSVALPTSIAGSNLRLTNSGTATSELSLNLSLDNQFFVVGGYDANVGTASVATTTSSTVQRVVGRVSMGGLVDTSTGLGSTIFSASNIRSAFTSNGTDFWAAGANGGIVYSGLGGSGAGIISSTSTNNRVVNGSGGDVYFMTGAGTRGFYKIPGMPTAGSNTATNVFQTGATSSPYDFIIKDANTVYVADDTNGANAVGLQKWVFDGTNWSVAYSVQPLDSTGAKLGVRSLATDGSKIWAVTNTNAADTLPKLVTTSDLGGSFAAFSTLLTSGANTAIRGVEFVPNPVPEPATMAVLGLGVAGLVARRRSKR